GRRAAGWRGGRTALAPAPTGAHGGRPCRRRIGGRGQGAHRRGDRPVTRSAAMLRGINVGGHRKIAMADLRALLSRLGFTDVATLLQSGNAVFHGHDGLPDELADRIERAIADEFKMSVRCMVRTGPELRAVIEDNPFADLATQGSKFLALFLSASPDAELLARYDPRSLAPSEVQLGDRVIYQWSPEGSLAAPNVHGFVEKNLRVAVTARNWNTVTKLDTLLGACTP